MDMHSSGGPDTDRLMAMLRDYEASGRNPTIDGIPDDMQARWRCCSYMCANSEAPQKCCYRWRSRNAAARLSVTYSTSAGPQTVSV